MFSSGSKVSLLLAAVALVTCCHGYSLGPPLEACQDMFPHGHDVAAQTDPSPFSFKLNTTSYNPGDTIEVFLNSSGEWFLEGALIQVRSVDCTNMEAVGTFHTQANENFLEPFNCFNRPGSALRHHTHLHIYNRTFYWTAPTTASGHLYLRATIARNKATFWTNVFSDYIMDNSDTSAEVQICDVTASSANFVKSAVIFVGVMTLCTLFFVG